MKQTSKKHPKKKWIKVLLIVILALLVLALVTIGALLFMTQSSKGLFDYRNPYPMPDVLLPEENPVWKYNGQEYQYNEDVISVLVLGTDETDNVEEKPDYHQADTIILLAINKETGQMDLLPIPRDTYVPIMKFDFEGDFAFLEPGPICIAHSNGQTREMGGQLMESSVSFIMKNVPVNRFVSFTMDSISAATDFVGGVPVEMAEDFQSISGVPAGETMVLDGEMAELYVRARSMAQMDGSNLSRMKRQKDYLMSLINVVIENTKKDLTFPSGLYRSLSPYFSTDMNLHELLYLSNICLRNIDNINMHSLDGEMDGKNFVPDEECLRKYISEIYGVPVEDSPAATA